jgi:DNA processing protein
MSGVWQIERGGPGYPPALLHLRRGDQPKLYGIGDRDALLRLHDDPAVTIVGSRRASAYGLRVAEGIARELALAGVTVISGMALGIDSAAHRGALAGGGPSIAVLAGGPDRPSPPSNRELHRLLAASGAVISEHAPRTPIRPHHFAHRNRIMAALGQVVLIVEAAQPSGSLVTVDRALELGRTVAAVPGQVGVRVAEGTNDLIREGAALIRDARDVLDLLFGVGGGLGGLTKRPPPRPGPALDRELAVVLDLVRSGAATVDGLAASGGLEPRRVAIALARLERLGYVRADELGGYAGTDLVAPRELT